MADQASSTSNGARATVTLEAQRDAAMSALPFKLPTLKEERKGSKLYITVTLHRPRTRRWWIRRNTIDRTFGLDKYGEFVYQHCNGEQSVRQIVAIFAEQTRISLPEAEVAVTQFMRTLMAKGLIAMQMEKPSA